jgi:hypothetical protein
VLKDSELTAISSGTGQNADSTRKASSKITLFNGPAGAVLHFEEFAATNRPDVCLSLQATADNLKDAVKILVPKGDGDSRATVRGTFAVQLPDTFAV